MQFEGEKFEEIPPQQKEEAEKEEMRVPEERPRVPEWRTREIEEKFPEEFEGKTEEEILKEVLEKKPYAPLNKEELYEFHHLAHDLEVTERPFDYKNYKYRGGISPLEKRTLQEKEGLKSRFKELKSRWIEEMKELYGPYWLMNRFTYESLSREGRQKLGKEIIKFWKEFYIQSGIQLDSRLERMAILTDVRVPSELSILKEQQREKVREETYREVEENKKRELNLINADLLPDDRKTAEEIMKIAFKKYAHVVRK